MTEEYKTSSHNWEAKWIWCKEADQKNTVVYFRKEFILNEIKNEKVYVTADTRYRLFVNGSYVRCGPVQSQPYYTYYDECEISSFLSKGMNTIACEVYYGGHIANTRGGLLLEVRQDDGTVVVKSSDSFKTCISKAWDPKSWGQWCNRYAPYQEFYDARKEPVGFKENGFDDSLWESAVIISGMNGMDTPPAAGPWSLITKRPIPDMKETLETPIIVKEEECLYLMNRFRAEDLSLSLSQAGTPLLHSKIMHIKTESGEQLEVSCTMDGVYGGIYNPAILLDFQKEVTAYFEIEVEGVQGQIIEIGYAERLVDGYFNNALECQFADRFTLKEGRQIFRSFNWRGYRYVRLIFKDCMTPLKIIRVNGVVTEYPFEERGKFASNDAKLQDVFEICKSTIKLCCNEAIVDTPWREQSQWVGDVAAVTLGGIYSVFGDTILSKKFLNQSAKNQFQTGLICNVTNTTADGSYLASMIDYNFWWVISVWDYYMYTGEEEMIHKLYPVICKLMFAAAEYTDSFGMLNRVPYYIFLDWTVNDKRGECCGLNAIYYGALMAVEKMAQLKGDQYMTAHVSDAMQAIKKNYCSRFYSEEQGLFVAANIDGTKSELITEATNMLSIYFGLSNQIQTDKIFERLFYDKTISYVEACPFLSLYTLKAANLAGKTELALSIIQEKWYQRFVQIGLSTTAEEWSMNGSYRRKEFVPIFRSLSHAWSAGPAEFMIKDLNKIRIVEPGGKKVEVTLMKLSSDYEVVYPLVHGSIKITQKNGEITCRASKGIELVLI